MAAMSAIRHNQMLQPFIARLHIRGLLETEIIVAGMQKLLHIAFCIPKSGQSFDADLLKKKVA